MKTTTLTDAQILDALCDSLEVTAQSVSRQSTSTARHMQTTAKRFRDDPIGAAFQIQHCRDFLAELADADPITDTRWRERRDELLRAANRYQDQARCARADTAIWMGRVAKILNILGVDAATADSENLHLAEVAAASQVQKIEQNYERETKALRGIISETAAAAGAMCAESATIDFMRHLPEEVRLKIGRLRKMAVENDQRFGRISAQILAVLGAYTIGEEDKAIAEIARRLRSAEELLGGVGGIKVAGGWQFPVTERPRRAVDWYPVKDMTPHQIGELIREPKVMIRTDRGVWRADAQGHAIDQNDPKAGIYTGLEALRYVCDLGTEKEAHLGIIRPVERVSA